MCDIQRINLDKSYVRKRITLMQARSEDFSTVIVTVIIIYETTTSTGARKVREYIIYLPTRSVPEWKLKIIIFRVLVVIFIYMRPRSPG